VNRIERRKKFRKERRRKRFLKQEERRKYKAFNTDRDIEVRIRYFGYKGLKPLAVATCEDCVDYQSGDCKGGRVPEECIKWSVLL
jgi:hypothetical protein